MQLLNIDVC